jgi:hypothetical protein
MSAKLTQQFKLHMRLGDGGYVYSYHIFDGDAVVGSISKVRDSQKVPERITYILHSTRDEFPTAKAFLEAYQRGLAAVE